MEKEKEIVKYQALFWGKLLEKMEKHRKDMQMTKGGLLKFITNEYYSKINSEYNK